MKSARKQSDSNLIQMLLAIPCHSASLEAGRKSTLVLLIKFADISHPEQDFII